MSLRYILFHHQTTTFFDCIYLYSRCVISSFITKPQLFLGGRRTAESCVISSFITKPQLGNVDIACGRVALYPLSSPNHNISPSLYSHHTLRYILFHHQTTTLRLCCLLLLSCVISSFITKPQQQAEKIAKDIVALYPLSSPNHNLRIRGYLNRTVALYPLSSPNHNCRVLIMTYLLLRYILFHHQTTTSTYPMLCPTCCVISSFITKPQRLSAGCGLYRVALYPLSSPNHNWCSTVYILL